MNFVRLCTVDSTFEADSIRDALAEKGIECIVTNEYLTTLLPLMNGMLGAGIQILVHKNDLQLSKDVVEGRNRMEVATCPNCGSGNITYGLGTTRRTKRIIALAIALLVASPTKHIRQTYYCKDCKSEFGAGH